MRDAKEDREIKMAGRNPYSRPRNSGRPLLSRAVLFKVTHSGQSETGSTQSLHKTLLHGSALDYVNITRPGDERWLLK